MSSKSMTVLLILVSLSACLIVGGCRHRRGDGASMKGSNRAEASIAPSSTDKNGNTATVSIADKGGEGMDFAEREEIRRSYQLDPGAKVEITGINGRIDVETADTKTAEVLIIRSAKKKEDLQFRQINIEHQPDQLRIRVEDDRKSIWSALSSSTEGRQRVMLKIPRKVDFEIRGLNGPLTVGEIEGPVQVNGNNGQVKIGQLSGNASFRGINGHIEMTIAKLSQDGIEIAGVNGNTELRFVGEVNADVEAHGMNGRIEPDLPNVEVRKSEGFGVYNARIGSGGARIKVRGVNGNVYLNKAEKISADASRSTVKVNPK